MYVDISDKPLKKFLEAADSTAQKIIESSTPGFVLVQEVDDLFRLQVWGQDVDLDPIPVILGINTYYSYLGAVRIAISGQAAAVFPLNRHSLECACYCYLISKAPELGGIWLARNKGPDERKACRRSFGSAVSDVSKMVMKEQPKFGALIDEIYQASIDFGGHPNFRSIFDHMTLTELEEGAEVSIACLYGEDDFNVQSALLACAEHGIVAAYITALSAKNHPLIDPEFTSLDQMYERVRETVADITS